MFCLMLSIADEYKMYEGDFPQINQGKKAQVVGEILTCFTP